MGKRGGFPGGMGGFGGMNLNSLMKEAKKMQADLERNQSELIEKEFDASAGGGAVTVKVSGAKAIKELMEEHNLTQEQLAKTLGKSRSAIANTVRILNLDERVIDLVNEGKLTEGHARSLVAITNQQKQYKLAMDIVNLDMSVREAETLVKEEKQPKAPKKNTSEKLEIIYKDFENRLKNSLGTKVAFRPQTKSKGKIIIEYFNSDELERLLEKFEN